jgi:hypothetical protein
MSEWDQQLCLETNICGKQIVRTFEQSKKSHRFISRFVKVKDEKGVTVARG